jgi:hypothetical protein
LTSLDFTLTVPSGLLQAAVAQDPVEEDTLTQRIIDRTFQEIEQEAEQELTQDQV